MVGDICKYDNKFNCWKWSACSEQTLTTCLKNGIVLLSREVMHLKHHKMQKHTVASIKWRNSSFYYRRKCKTLECFILENGLKIPLIKGNKTEGEDAVYNNDKKEESPKGLSSSPSENGAFGDKPSS